MNIQRQLWDAMLGSYEDCQSCDIGTFAKKHVFGRGPLDSKIVFIGEGPGKLEDLEGKPFVGRAGQLLSKAIKATGSKLNCFYTNLVLCRPCDRLGGPNRPPTEQEVNNCKERLRVTLRTINPRVVVLLGRTARMALGNEKPLLGDPMFAKLKVFTMEHPAFILRVGGTKSPAFPIYVQKIKEALNAAV